MKKFIVTIVAAVAGLLSQAAVAAEPSPLYVGAGFTWLSDGGTPVSSQEQMFLSGGPYQAGRTEKDRGVGGDIFVGYKLTKSLAVEAGYPGGGSGLGSKVAGTVNFTDFWGNRIRDPFSVTQTKKVSAWYAAAVGEKSLTDRISVIGRLGVLQSRTDWEQRVKFGCAGPGCGVDEQYQGTSSSSTKTALLLGAGIEMAVTKSISARAEIVKSSALPSTTAMLSLVFHP